MDFITDLPEIRGHNAVMTVVDKLMKYTVCVPCALGEGQLSATAVANMFFEHIVSRFGVPQSLISDRDPRFTSSFWK